MKKMLLTLMMALIAFISESQPIHSVMTPAQGDSLQQCLQRASNDSLRLQALGALGEYYLFIRQDSAIYYTTQEIERAEETDHAYQAFVGYSRLSFILNTLSNYPKALEMALKALKIAEQLNAKREESMAECYHLMGLLNNRMGNDSIALNCCLRSMQLYEQSGVPTRDMDFGSSLNAGLIYLKRHQTDSALFYAKMSYDVTLQYPYASRIHVATTTSTLARMYEEMKNLPAARQYYLIGLNTVEQYVPSLLTVRFYNLYARFFQRTGNSDSCLYYAQTALDLCRNKNFGEHATDAASILSQVYESRRMPDSALKYLKVMLATRDTIMNQSKLQQVMLLNFDEGQRQKDIAAAKEKYRNQLRFYTLISAVTIFLLLSIVLYRNNRNKQKANAILRAQKVEIEQQRSKVELALQELTVTQKQLVQSEKMASLGELTSGIAHEIQNPLNFVNNFSEVNAELIKDLKGEAAKGNLHEVTALADDIAFNSEKINHHGRRAEAIVKSMLQHSRTGAGQKELTDINTLCDEHLRLAYHGFRAKDKSFHAKFETSFDEGLARISVVPQDIGRVILNLISNALYEVNEKRKRLVAGYEPRVSVSTKRVDDKVLVRIADNGDGIPEKILDKIFQPFFTTKPTGQGTGLGLSLAYDIVKAHGGEIKVETRENEGTEFTMVLAT